MSNFLSNCLEICNHELLHIVQGYSQGIGIKKYSLESVHSE